MKKQIFLFAALGLAGFLIASCVTSGSLSSSRKIIPIVLSSDADKLEWLAARELGHYLEILYPKYYFPARTAANGGKQQILLGSIQTFPGLNDHVRADELSVPESYVVTHEQSLGVIAGADPRGALFAVYALLEELGFGFYLSYETAPSPRSGRIDFADWNIKDAPIVNERFVLNWHNFMSGCSSWYFEDWQKWITQLSKMRFNTMMVHAYGNNPMEWFEHNGEYKPVGYLTTTQKGRDWGTQHVNDVRRMFGGKEVFEGPVFGSEAAKVPDEKRVNAAVALMRQTFAFAEKRGMDILYAMDVDTFSANPENIILTLPESARLTVHGKPVANPDTPEGLEYYKARVGALLKHYPEIDKIALWFRRSLTGSLGTVWRAIKVEEYPAEWKTEYQRILNEHPEAADDPESPSLFAIAKIAKAFREALDSMGRNDVTLSTGSWGFNYLPAAHVFLPEDMTIIPLDYDVNVTSPDVTQQVYRTSKVHPVAPIVWAHHDDHTYIGRPYTPFPDYGTYLQKHNFKSLGIIHWTTKPLDLYFKNMSRQVWRRTLDEPVRQTCFDMAELNFGKSYRNSLGEYLADWIHNAPMFGRETTDTFIDRPLKNAEELTAACEKRLLYLNALDTRGMTPGHRERFLYFKRLEEFCVQFYQNQTALDRGKTYLKNMQINQLYQSLEAMNPEKAIESYAQLAQLGGMTAGEKGILVSLNLRWYPYFMSLRQQMREEPIRINFQPTQHDALAQAPGHHTFFIDGRENWWVGLGQMETGLETFTTGQPVKAQNPGEEEIGRTGIKTSHKQRISLRPFDSKILPSGKYNVHLYFVEPEFTKPGERIFTLTMWNGKIESSKPVPLVKDRIDIFQWAGEQNRVVKLTYPIDIQNEDLIVELNPVRNEALLCGAILEPVELQERL